MIIKLSLLIIVGSLFTTATMAECKFGGAGCDPYKLQPVSTLELEPVLRIIPKPITPKIIEKSDLQWCHEYFGKTPSVQRNKKADKYCLYLFERESRGKVK